MERKIPNENVTERDLKRIIKQANRTEEQVELKKFVIILLGVFIVIVTTYFLTRNMVEKNNANNAANNKKAEVTFDYSKIILGELLNRPYDEYYVLVYNSKNPRSNYYYNFASMYMAKDDALKIYVADLNDDMNSKFYSKKESNKDAKSVDELKVGDLTLIKVKDKQIVKYIEDEDGINTELGL